MTQTGVLIGNLFSQLFNKFIKNLILNINKRPDILLILSRINLITTGLRTCFATGNWGIQKNAYMKTGVSQVLSRLSYIATVSHLRRLVIAVGKEGKNTKIRQIHPSQIGFICNVESPEGHAAGNC